MPGPCSLPQGSKKEYAELNEIVCNVHYNCNMQIVDKHGNEIRHEYITYREWLSKRNRLRTGKTL